MQAPEASRGARAGTSRETCGVVRRSRDGPGASRLSRRVVPRRPPPRRPCASAAAAARRRAQVGERCHLGGRRRLGARRDRAPLRGVEREQGGDADADVAVAPLELARREQQRLGAGEQAEALVDVGHQHEVDEPELVLEQQEDDAVRARGALAGDREAGQHDLLAVAQLEQVAARDDAVEAAADARRSGARGRRRRSSRSRRSGSSHSDGSPSPSGAAPMSRSSTSWRLPSRPAAPPRTGSPSSQSRRRRAPSASQAPDATSRSRRSIGSGTRRASSPAERNGPCSVRSETTTAAPSSPSPCT